MTVEITATKQVVICPVTRQITSSVLMVADVSLHHGNVMDRQIVMMEAMKAAVIQVRYLLSTRQASVDDRSKMSQDFGIS